MSTQEYFHVFESVLYAAIVTQVLVGWSKMIANHGSYKLSWIHLLITVNLILTIVQRYYVSMYFGHHELIVNSLSFLVIIIIPLSLAFMGAFALFPKSYSGVDFDDVVVRNRVIVGLGSFALVGFSLFRNIFIVESVTIPSVLPHILFILLWIWFIISKNLKIAAVASILAFIGLCYYLWVA